MENTKNVDENYTDRVISQNRYKLSFEQQKLIESNLSCSDLLGLAKTVYPEVKKMTKHSEEFINVRSYFAKAKKNVRNYNFTKDQLDFIANNGARMRPIDMARKIFPSNTGALANEARSIGQYCKAMGITIEEADLSNEDVDGDYEPPQTDHKIIGLINRATFDGNFMFQKLDNFKRSCIASLKQNMQTPRFVATLNSIKRKDLRSLFEVEFVNATYDKPDLNSEDRNLYVTTCYDYILAVQIQEQISYLNDRVLEIDKDEEGRKLTQALVDALSSKTSEYNDCQSRIMKNVKELSGSRSKRNELKIQENESLVKFIKEVEQEDKRKKFILAARAQELEIRNEVQKIANYDSLFAEVHGISLGEILK